MFGLYGADQSEICLISCILDVVTCNTRDIDKRKYPCSFSQAYLFYLQAPRIIAETIGEHRPKTHVWSRAMLYEPGHSISYKTACAPNEDSISLRGRTGWSVFAVHRKTQVDQCSQSTKRCLVSLTKQRVPCEESDQTAHLRSLIRVFVGRTFTFFHKATESVNPIFAEYTEQQGSPRTLEWIADFGRNRTLIPNWAIMVK